MRSLRPVVVVLCSFALCLAGTSVASAGKGGGGGRGRSSCPGGNCKKNSGGGGGGYTKTHKGSHGGSSYSSTKPQRSSPQPQLAGGSKKATEQKVARQKPAQERTAKTSIRSGDGAAEPAYNKKEKQLQLAQQQRDKKLSQAEHLRQIAERNGNANLAANADRMEAQALQQYEQKVAHLEKFGVTDPALEPGDGVSDPLLDDAGELLSDPLGSLGGVVNP